MEPSIKGRHIIPKRQCFFKCKRLHNRQKDLTLAPMKRSTGLFIISGLLVVVAIVIVIYMSTL